MSIFVVRQWFYLKILSNLIPCIVFVYVSSSRRAPYNLCIIYQIRLYIHFSQFIFHHGNSNSNTTVTSTTKQLMSRNKWTVKIHPPPSLLPCHNHLNQKYKNLKHLIIISEWGLCAPYPCLSLNSDIVLLLWCDFQTYRNSDTTNRLPSIVMNELGLRFYTTTPSLPSYCYRI